MSDLKLYFIMAEHPEEDFSLDLFVTARDRTEATELWMDYFGYDADDVDLEEYKVRIVEVPQVASEPRAHQWHTELTPTYLHNRSLELENG